MRVSQLRKWGIRNGVWDGGDRDIAREWGGASKFCDPFAGRFRSAAHYPPGLSSLDRTQANERPPVFYARVPQVSVNHRLNALSIPASA